MNNKDTIRPESRPAAPNGQRNRWLPRRWRSTWPRSWTTGERNGKTLVREPDFRVVLTAMRAGTRLAEHEANARLAIQTVDGHLRVHLSGRVVDLPANHLLALDRSVPHEVEAIEDSALLLTLAWPGAGGGA